MAKTITDFFKITKEYPVQTNENRSELISYYEGQVKGYDEKIIDMPGFSEEWKKEKSLAQKKLNHLKAGGGYGPAYDLQKAREI
jgi:hypothetical protein